MPVPSPENYRNSLSAVAALPSGDIWAVGTSITGTLATTLVLHGSYARTAPSTPPAAPVGMPRSGGVSAAADGEAFSPVSAAFPALLAALAAAILVMCGLALRQIYGR